MESASPGKGYPVDRVMKAFQANDASQVQTLLDQHPDLKSRIDEPWGPFDSPLIVNVRSRPMLDVLLDAGANLNAKSHWWAGGFGLLDWASPELAAYAIERGAHVDVHAAARLGMLDRLRELVTGNFGLVHARGGDGKTPLHSSSNVQVEAPLIELLQIDTAGSTAVIQRQSDEVKSQFGSIGEMALQEPLLMLPHQLFE